MDPVQRLKGAIQVEDDGLVQVGSEFQLNPLVGAQDVIW